MSKIISIFRESYVARFLIPFGLILTIFGIITFVITLNNQDFIKTEAVVTKTELVNDSYLDEDGNFVDATYNVYIKYTVDGTEYNELLGELSNYKVGQKTTIYYNPSNPKEITQVKSLLLPIIIIVAGVLAFVGGIVSGIYTIKKL